MLRSVSLPLFVVASALAGCSQSVAVDKGTLEVTDAPTDASLGDDDDTTAVGDDDDTVGATNEAPVADAGADLEALVADEVELDGRASYDPDGDPITWSWLLVDKPIGSSATLINEDRSNPSFYADREGAFVVRLEVDDGQDVSTDEVVVQVAAPNEGPVASAGPDQTVTVGDNVILNGSSSYDPDGDVLNFQWTLLSKPGGSVATLTSPNTALPQFVADLPGLYVAELVVSDADGASPADQVRITAQDAGGDDGGCLSCGAANQELQRRMRMGDLASVGAIGLLPALVAWRRRRRT